MAKLQTLNVSQIITLTGSLNSDISVVGNDLSTNYYTKSGVDGLDEWELNGGFIRPKASLQSNSVKIGTPSTTVTVTGSNFSNSTNITFNSGSWENAQLQESNPFNYGNYNTSDSSPYAVSESGIDQSYYGWYAFDGLINNVQHSCQITSNNGYILLDVGTAKTFVGMKYKTIDGYTDRSVRDFNVAGSNDATNWTTLLTVAGAGDASGSYSPNYSFTTTGSFKYYKLTATLLGIAKFASFHEVQYFESSPATTDNYVTTPNLCDGTMSFAPGSVVIYDDSNSIILGTGKVNLAYSVNGGSYSSFVDLQTFKSISSSLFASATSVMIRVQPVGAQKVKSLSISTTSGAVQIDPNGEVSVIVDGVTTDTLSNKMNKTVSSVWTEIWDTAGTKDLGTFDLSGAISGFPLILISSDVNSVIGGYSIANIIANGVQSNIPTFDGYTSPNWVNTDRHRNLVSLLRVGDSIHWNIGSSLSRVVVPNPIEVDVLVFGSLGVDMSQSTFGNYKTYTANLGSFDTANGYNPNKKLQDSPLADIIFSAVNTVDISSLFGIGLYTDKTTNTGVLGGTLLSYYAYGNSNDNNYTLFLGFDGVVKDNDPAIATGDILRFRRTPLNELYFEVSKDSGSSWITVAHKTVSGDLYPRINIGAVSSASLVKCNGSAA